MELIGNSKAIKAVKTLVELNLDFLAVESNVFSFNEQQDIDLLYNPKSTDDVKDKVAEILADKVPYSCNKFLIA